MERPAARFFVNGEDRYRSADAWPPADATPTTPYLDGTHSGAVGSLNDGSLIAQQPAGEQLPTSWSVLELHTASDQTDLAVIVKLSLVSADPAAGQAKVSQGWLRVSHRHEDPELTRDMRPFLTTIAPSRSSPASVPAAA